MALKRNKISNDRAVGTEGWGILTDKLILSQPGGGDYTHHIIDSPPLDFQTFLQSCASKKTLYHIMLIFDDMFVRKFAEG